MGFLVTFLFVVLVTAGAESVLKKFLKNYSVPEQIGYSGLIGLGILGTLLLPIGLLPAGLTWGIPLLAGSATLLGLWATRSLLGRGIKVAPPAGPLKWCLLAFAFMAIFPLVAVLSPGNMLDWDTLAYQVAVPKIWLLDGQIHYVHSLHQSNFPFAINNLYLFGLWWGGISGAKAFTFCFFILGASSLYGLCSRLFNSQIAPYALIAWAGIPVVLWEAGTGYIDLTNGLYLGLGVILIADFVGKHDGQDLVTPSLLLGLALGSKFTALQTILILFILGALTLFVKKRIPDLRPFFLAFLAAALIASPWYIKTAISTGNPVYPFFFKQLGGREWDQWRADVYQDEQLSFGVGRLPKGRDFKGLGHAILGLAYQPGRYTNPAPTEGQGSPVGSIGMIALLGFGLTALQARRGTRERLILAVTLVNFLAWFVLSQQSRYLVGLVFPGLVMAVGLLADQTWGKVLKGLVIIQALLSVWILQSLQFTAQLQADLGIVSHEDYLKHNIPFALVAKDLNENNDVKKVALYDEVFGIFLDKPYMWANPGHGTLIPYATMQTGAEYVAAMKALGFTHIYVSWRFLDQATRNSWLASLGLTNGPFFTEQQHREMFSDLRTKWRWLLADAARKGLIRPLKASGGGGTFAIP